MRCRRQYKPSRRRRAPRWMASLSRRGRQGYRLRSCFLRARATDKMRRAGDDRKRRNTCANAEQSYPRLRFGRNDPFGNVHVFLSPDAAARESNAASPPDGRRKAGRTSPPAWKHEPHSRWSCERGRYLEQTGRDSHFASLSAVGDGAACRRVKRHRHLRLLKRCLVNKLSLVRSVFAMRFFGREFVVLFSDSIDAAVFRAAGDDRGRVLAIAGRSALFAPHSPAARARSHDQRDGLSARRTREAWPIMSLSTSPPHREDGKRHQPFHSEVVDSSSRSRH